MAWTWKASSGRSVINGRRRQIPSPPRRDRRRADSPTLFFFSFSSKKALPGNVSGVEWCMSTDVPSSGDFSRPLKVTATPAPGRVAMPVSDPFTAAIQVPVAQVPITELLEEPVKDGAAPTAPVKDGAAPTASPSSKEPSGKSASSKEVADLVDALAALLRAFPASAINVNLAALPDDLGVLK